MINKMNKAQFKELGQDELPTEAPITAITSFLFMFFLYLQEQSYPHAIPVSNACNQEKS